jgi:hypothetical protein
LKPDCGFATSVFLRVTFAGSTGSGATIGARNAKQSAQETRARFVVLNPSPLQVGAPHMVAVNCVPVH